MALAGPPPRSQPRWGALAILRSVDQDLAGACRYLVLDDPLPGAAVRGCTLIVSRGARPHRVPTAVLAHELGHADSFDGRLTEALGHLALWGCCAGHFASPASGGQQLTATLGGRRAKRCSRARAPPLSGMLSGQGGGVATAPVCVYSRVGTDAGKGIPRHRPDRPGRPLSPPDSTRPCAPRARSPEQDRRPFSKARSRSPQGPGDDRPAGQERRRLARLPPLPHPQRWPLRPRIHVPPPSRPITKCVPRFAKPPATPTSRATPIRSPLRVVPARAKAVAEKPARAKRHCAKGRHAVKRRGKVSYVKAKHRA